jgi:hypothetical protein
VLSSVRVERSEIGRATGLAARSTTTSVCSSFAQPTRACLTQTTVKSTSVFCGYLWICRKGQSPPIFFHIKSIFGVSGVGYP